MSSRKSPKSGEPPSEFAAEMDQLGEVSITRDAVPRVKPAGGGTKKGADPPSATSAATEFHFPRADERLLAHRPGVRARELKRLRAGALPATRSVDLHGCTRDAARLRLRQEIAEAHRAGEVCVRVIHGRGRHSSDGDAVLKRDLPEWLTRAPLAALIRAFAPAQQRDGGGGACYVLLCVSTDDASD